MDSNHNINQPYNPIDELEKTNAFPTANPPINYWGQLGLLLGLIGGGLIIASVLSIVVFLVMTGVNAFEIEKEILNPKNVAAIRALQVVSTLFVFLVPAFLFALIAYKKPFQFFGFSKKISIQQIGIVILIGCAGVFVSALMADINEWIPISKTLQAKFKLAEENYNKQVLLIAKMNNLKDYIAALVLIAMLPAVFEELLFRGAMQQFFINWFKTPIVAIVLTSIIFSAIHMSYYGFLARATLGVSLGLVYYYGKNIWLPIIIHFVNNSIAVTALYVYSIKGKPVEEVLNEKYPIWLGLICVLLLISLLIQFKKESTKINATA
jgi:uncharacterized protein